MALVPVWLWVGYTDWRYRRIDHWCVVYLILAGLALLYLTDAAMVSVLKQSMAVLGIGYLLWWMNLVGAGDVKLFFGLSLWHVGELLALALYMTVMGAVIALAHLVYRVWRKRHAGEQDQGIPYGIAIVMASAVLHT